MYVFLSNNVQEALQIIPIPFFDQINNNKVRKLLNLEKLILYRCINLDPFSISKWPNRKNESVSHPYPKKILNIIAFLELDHLNRNLQIKQSPKQIKRFPLDFENVVQSANYFNNP